MDDLAAPSLPAHLASIAESRCVVLGAGGFLGQSLIRRLLAAGVDTTGFGRRSAGTATPQFGVHWHEGIFEDERALRRAIANQDFVFHLIGPRRPAESNLNPKWDAQQTILPTLTMLEIARAEGVKKIVFASSGGAVYGTPASVPLPVSEFAPTDPITAYGISKLATEKYLALYRRLHGLDYHVLRIANCYGPGQRPNDGQGVVATLMHRALAGEPIEIWGDGSVVRDFVYVDDVANALMVGASYSGTQRVMNVGSGVGRTILSVAQDVARLLGREVPVMNTPGRVADAAVNVLDIDLIARETGWVPTTTWLQGLENTAIWMRGK